MLKTCCTCKVEKPTEEFYNRKSTKDGKNWRCIECCKAFSKSERGRAIARKYRSSPKGKAEALRHKLNYDFEPAHRKYNHSNKGIENRAEYEKKFPEKRKARTSVANAIKSNEIIRPSTCSNCRKEHHKIIGHHWSYLPEHRLDVIWLCPSCHKLIHQNTATSST